MKISHRFIRDNRFGIEGRVGYTGAAYWDGFTLPLWNTEKMTWSVGGYLLATISM